MAKGTLIDSLENTRTLKYANASAVAMGDVVVVNGQVLVALGDYSAAAVGLYAYRGKVSLPKTVAQAQPAGSIIYWDATNGVTTTTATSNTRLGIAVEDAAAADTSGIYMLKEN